MSAGRRSVRGRDGAEGRQVRGKRAGKLPSLWKVVKVARIVWGMFRGMFLCERVAFRGRGASL